MRVRTRHSIMSYMCGGGHAVHTCANLEREVRCVPESSIVLKKIGAILPPMQMPPPRLLGMHGRSSPMYHSTEFVADLRDEPVPTCRSARFGGGG